MNWEVAGAIGEVVGAAAVVISVAYLAFQIKQQTEQSRLAASRELGEQLGALFHTITADDQFATIYQKAVQDYDRLPNNERLRMSLLFQRIMRLLEQQYLHISKGNINPAHFESVSKAYDEWLTFPGVQSWWEGSRSFFEEEFRERIDNAIYEAKEQGYESSFKNPPSI